MNGAIKKGLLYSSVLLIAASSALLIYAAYRNKQLATNHAPQVYSEKRMLLELWNSSKKYLLEESTGRTLDKSANNITTSEGQSYTMMRAVWMDDRDTFNKAWQWSKDNLQRPDHLMSWKFGKKDDGTYGVLDINSASDADSDMVYALLMASGRWKDYGYKADAQTLLAAIWEHEIVTIAGKPVLAANNMEKSNPDSAIVNPSYFAPYAYRAFAKLDKKHDWNAVIDSSYDILARSTSSTLDDQQAAGLVPDWLRVSKADGTFMPLGVQNYSTNYGYDAIRTPWRLALDYKWHNDTRAKNILAGMNPVINSWQTNQQVHAVYRHDGTVADSHATPAASGTTLALLDVVNPTQASALYQKQLLPYYSPDTQSWSKELPYYDDNWAWFGIALHTNQLPNLTELINE